jgi:hypothetical protein
MKLFILYIFFIIYFLYSDGEYVILNYTLNNIDLMIAGILPLKIYKNLSSPENFRSELHRVGGVYGLINTNKNIKQYIGSSKDLYHRLMDHLKGRDSNSRLPPFALFIPSGRVPSLPTGERGRGL